MKEKLMFFERLEQITSRFIEMKALISQAGLLSYNDIPQVPIDELFDLLDRAKQILTKHGRRT
jgi:hypothetical protein